MSASVTRGKDVRLEDSLESQLVCTSVRPTPLIPVPANLRESFSSLDLPVQPDLAVKIEK